MQRMVRSPEQPLTRRLLAVAVGGAVAAAALVGWVGQVAESRGARAAAALGGIGPGKLGQVRGLELGADGEIPAGIAAAGRRALPDNPLAFEPFFAVAAEHFRDKRSTGSPQDGVLLREALRRNPRSREARLLLMRHAVGRGDLRDAIDQLAVLNRLNTGIVEQLMLALGNAISTPRQVDEAVAALGPHGELYHPFLRGFAIARKPAPLITRLIGAMPRSALADPAVRVIAINQMVQAQAFAEARALWASGQASGGNGLVHSPDFADRTAPPPFNWQLEESSTGVAERAATGGLMAEYYGRESGLLASQLLTLAPGNYRALLDYRTTSGTPGGMALQLRCAGGGAVLGQVPLRAAVGTGQKLALEFTVPGAECRGQSLALVGLPLEERNAQAIEARSLGVERGGRS